MGWHNVSKREECPICHKTDWCNLSDDGVVAICHRVESPYPARGGGWIHRLRDEVEGWRLKVEQRRDNSIVPPSTSHLPPALDFSRVHRGYDADEVLVEGLATELGVDAEALKAMDVRFNRMDECWSFPMRDAEGRIVGLRYRELGGSRKWSARGSKDGLFMVGNREQGIGNRYGRCGGDLVIVEGASDTAAALSLGLWAVGRSSCQTGAALLRALIRAKRPRTVTIVADNDEPGVRGATQLAAQLAGPRAGQVEVEMKVEQQVEGCRLQVEQRNVQPVRVLVVPHPWKDVRAWWLSGKLTAKVFWDLVSAQRWCGGERGGEKRWRWRRVERE